MGKEGACVSIQRGVTSFTYTKRGHQHSEEPPFIIREYNQVLRVNISQYLSWKSNIATKSRNSTFGFLRRNPCISTVLNVSKLKK